MKSLKNSFYKIPKIAVGIIMQTCC